MLVKLTPEQSEKGWNLIWGFLQKSLPRNVVVQTEAEVNVLHSILSEVAHVWLDYGKKGEPRAMILTTILKDEVAGGKALLIYALILFPWAKASAEDYHEGLDTLKLYGKKEGCLNMIMYVQDERFVRFLRQLGVSVTQQLLTMEV